MVSQFEAKTMDVLGHKSYGDLINMKIWIEAESSNLRTFLFARLRYANFKVIARVPSSAIFL